MSEYNSSIIFKYSDIDNVKKDAVTIHEIISRQGTSLLIDCIAEHVGRTANKFKLKLNESRLARNSIVKELNHAINERI
jgi:hypothetical protein